MRGGKMYLEKKRKEDKERQTADFSMNNELRFINRPQCRFTQIQVNTQTHTHTHIHIHIYVKSLLFCN